MKAHLRCLTPGSPDLNLYARSPCDASFKDINNPRPIHRNRHPIRHFQQRHIEYQVQVIPEQLLLLHRDDGRSRRSPAPSLDRSIRESPIPGPRIGSGRSGLREPFGVQRYGRRDLRSSERRLALFRIQTADDH